MDCALDRVEVRLVLNFIIQSDLTFLENGLQQEILDNHSAHRHLIELQ